jgi:hypothetical protein
MRSIYILIIFLSLASAFRGAAQPQPPGEIPDSLQYNLKLLKRYLSEGDKWHFTDPNTEKRLSGLIHFVENEPIDTIINHLKGIGKNSEKALIIRLPKDAPDTLSMPGYISYRQLLRQLNIVAEEIIRDFQNKTISYPPELFYNLENNVPIIPEGLGMQLITDGIYKLPDSLKVSQGISEEFVQNPQDFKRIMNLDSIRSRYVEGLRVRYNDSLIGTAKNKRMEEYRHQKMLDQIAAEKSRRADAVKLNNSQVAGYNNGKLIIAVNDSLMKSAEWLAGFADFIDNSTVHLVNLTNSSSALVMSNSDRYFTRIWLKNQQNDSISVLVQSIDKSTIQLVIEDQEIFSRFRQQSVNDYDFSTLDGKSTALKKVGKRYQAYTPWTIGGNGTTGFTQTYLSNWKKGGKSALSILVVLKGFANYSSDRYKWENSAEIRDGWIKPGVEAIQKNDDKFELTSRFGVTAFQKWFYSTEADFETQFFNGYAYPDVNRPISGYLAPGRFMFKVGLDFKPSKNFSLFISPLTSKLVFVNDTLKIDKANFKISPGKKSYWEPGLNTDLTIKKNLTPEISFETKYKMFINYLKPFKDVDINWETTLQARLTEYISMQVMAHAIYDSKVLFDKVDNNGNPVLDLSGKKIKEPRLQFREFFTIGFIYRVNKRVVRAREVN